MYSTGTITRTSYSFMLALYKNICTPMHGFYRKFNYYGILSIKYMYSTVCTRTCILVYMYLRVSFVSEKQIKLIFHQSLLNICLRSEIIPKTQLDSCLVLNMKLNAELQRCGRVI